MEINPVYVILEFESSKMVVTLPDISDDILSILEGKLHKIEEDIRLIIG